MQCLKCGHKIPDTDERCLYCGAQIKEKASSETGTASPAVSFDQGRNGKNFGGIQAPQDGIDYKKLENLPLSLRSKVEEVLKKGEGKGEVKNPFENFPETLEGTRRRRKRMGPLAALRILLKKD